MRCITNSNLLLMKHEPERPVREKNLLVPLGALLFQVMEDFMLYLW
jgi:hypothetical protein